MSRYWETGYYSQPTEKEIKSRANATKKKESAKGKMLAPVTVTRRNIVKSWSARQITTAVLIVESDMFVPMPLLTFKLKKGEFLHEYRGQGKSPIR